VLELVISPSSLTSFFVFLGFFLSERAEVYLLSKEKKRRKDPYWKGHRKAELPASF
jgi:hypothetical protein